MPYKDPEKRKAYMKAHRKTKEYKAAQKKYSE